MRWERLFADLESQTEAELRQVEASELAERSRYEFGLLTLRERFESSTGAVLDLATVGSHRVRGRIRAVGVDWMLLAEHVTGSDLRRGETIVNLGRVLSVEGRGLADSPTEEPDPEALCGTGVRGIEALSLRHLLRGLGRDRAAVTLLIADGTSASGTIDRVARDHFELAAHPPDVARRARSVTRLHTFVTGAVAAVKVAD